MPETYAARKQRERQRDQIREWAWEAAQHTAGGDLNTVELVGWSEWPPVRFGPNVDGHRCECGMAMVPIPTFTKRWGMLPTWYCAVCSLEYLIEACAAVAREAAK